MRTAIRKTTSARISRGPSISVSVDVDEVVVAGVDEVVVADVDGILLVDMTDTVPEP